MHKGSQTAARLGQPRKRLGKGNQASVKQPLDEAERLFRRALAIKEAAHGADHPSTAKSAGALAKVLYLRAGKAPSSTNGGQAYYIKGNPKLQNRKIYVECELDEAEGLYRRVLAICEATHGLDHPETQGVLNALAKLLEDKGGGGYPPSSILRRPTFGGGESPDRADHHGCRAWATAPLHQLSG